MNARTQHCKLLILLGLLFGSRPLSAQIFFQENAIQQGIIHQYGVSIPGGGVSFVDFDGDGWDDITLATDDGQPIHFYKNSFGQFLQLEPLIDYTGQVGQLLWVDFDNDGDKDLYMATFQDANRLYENIGNLELVDVTEQAGLPIDSTTTYGASFGDYDRDGWLDLYYGRRTGVVGEATMALFRNNADGTFTETTVMANALDPGKIPFCSAFFDYNNDKWPDLYTAHDRFKRNTLLENNGDGTFSDISFFANAGLAMNAMCVTPGDYNNDNWLDIYITNTQQGNVLLQNNGNNTFLSSSVASGTAFFGYAWGSSFFDADNDGWEDLYVSGMLVGSDEISSAFYHNQQDGNFIEPAQAGFVGDTVASFNNAIGDFNRDGLNDIMVINTMPFHSHLWVNETTTDHQWIKIDLEGVLSNRDGIGARINVYTAGIQQTRYTTCGTGFMGQHSETLNLGVGSYSMIDSIVVCWPTGHIDRLTEVESGQTLLIIEGSTTDGDITIDPDVSLAVSTEVPGQPANRLNFRLFPNPVNSTLWVAWDSKEQVPSSIYLLDTNGRVLKPLLTKGRSLIPIDTKALPSGMYFIVSGQGTGKRFIKQ
jgi:hypothetical protein